MHINHAVATMLPSVSTVRLVTVETMPVPGGVEVPAAHVGSQEQGDQRTELGGECRVDDIDTASTR